MQTEVCGYTLLSEIYITKGQHMQVTNSIPCVYLFLYNTCKSIPAF